MSAVIESRCTRAGALLAALVALAVPPTANAQGERVLRARETARIGEETRTPFSFGKITGLAIDAAGHLYVSDAQDHRVVVFDASGKHVGTIGRKGKGPGEFQHPTSLAVAKDRSLWVREMNRVQRFLPEAPGGPATKYDAVVSSLGLADWTSVRTGVIDDDGLFHVPVSYTVIATRQHVQSMHRLGRDGVTKDSLMVPVHANAPAASASYRVSERSGRMLLGLNHVPFASVPAWASTPRGTIISGDGRTYDLREIDKDGTELRRFTRPYAPVTIDPAERRDSVRALEARIDSIPVPMAQVLGMPDDVREKRLPTQYPPFRELTVASDGNLWVRRWTTPAERGTSRYDVFAPDARFLGTIVLPAELIGTPTLVVNGRWAAGIATDPETGLQAIIRFEAPTAPGTESSVRPRS